jgi:4-hydroxy-2-oxoheptanedioate aldolase
MVKSSSLELSLLLRELSARNGLIGVKTSFEDEGATYREVQSLKNICSMSDISLVLKVQGSECKRDISDAISLDITKLVFPLVESAFAVTKIYESCTSLIPSSVKFAYEYGLNLESSQAVKNASSILDACQRSNIKNITFGRVDYVHSLSHARDFVDSPDVYNVVADVFRQSKYLGMKNFLGGAITTSSLDFISNLHSEGLLDCFETRYCIFDCQQGVSAFEESIGRSHYVESLILKQRLNDLEPKHKLLSMRYAMISKRF